MSLFGFQLEPSYLVLGLTVGITYGLLAVGLVIVYRISGVINFAHGAIGAIGAATLGMLVVGHHWPYWIAFVVSVAAAGLAGALAELAVVRRLRGAPKVMSLVATLGLSALFGNLAPVLFANVNTTLAYPQPTGLPSYNVGSLLVTPAFNGMIILSPLLVLGFALFLRFSRYGLALRGVAANAPTARTLGIYAGRMSTLAWVVASTFAAFTAILVYPTRGFSGGEPFGPSLLLRALGAAVVARLTSLPVAFAAGVGIGLVEQQIYANTDTPGVTSLFIFAIIFVALFLQRRDGSRTRAADAWAVVAAARTLTLPAEARRRLDRVTRLLLAPLLLFLLALPQLMNNANALNLATVEALAIVALSVGVVTGLGGHLSLGQFAFAGIGAAVSYRVAADTHNFLLSFLVAGFAAAAAAVVIGLPALRIRGIMYAVGTLGFAFASENYLFRQSWFKGVDEFPRPTVAGYTFETGRAYAYWSLGVLVLAVLLTVQVRRSGLGRSFIALRDNEDAARAYAVPAVRRALQLFALGGFVAGLGGACYAHGLQYVSGSDFTGAVSIDVVAAGVLGGLGYALGPLLGGLYIFGIPTWASDFLGSAGLAGTALGWLLLVLYFPGGLGSIVTSARDRAVQLVLNRTAVEPVVVAEEERGSALAQATLTSVNEPDPDAPAAPPAARQTLLTVSDLHKSYGGVRAVAGVSLELAQGEILGLIGPNGAGKTTFFELLSGFVDADSGSIAFLGSDITRSSPEARARLGIARSFQDSKLFPTMTVNEALRLAQERRVPLGFGTALFAGAASERRRDALARELIELMGLGTYADKRIGELSTGTRRIAELACVMSLEPKLLLLDEPSSGIAQRESEALGGLLRQIRDYLDATLVVIEHDVPLIVGLADRIAAMESGELLTVDVPSVVVNDPRVVASYLGGDVRAIERSGAGTATTAARKAAKKAPAKTSAKAPAKAPRKTAAKKTATAAKTSISGDSS